MKINLYSETNYYKLGIIVKNKNNDPIDVNLCDIADGDWIIKKTHNDEFYVSSGYTKIVSVEGIIYEFQKKQDEYEDRYIYSIDIEYIDDFYLIPVSISISGEVYFIGCDFMDYYDYDYSHFCYWFYNKDYSLIDEDGDEEDGCMNEHYITKNFLPKNNVLSNKVEHIHVDFD